ncbi:hypothetical protein SAMN05421810_101974 [Amycolatopsis arida]|uniref:Uncharacterized protein n=1 Tax=Amycolatopsis arida TaxID=587909 RepID=A0A1I5MNF1_9PSEU|nr:hypothetical protein [Amycolatopsis arida]TDX94145.1 hypothetical protein CLV69_104606 [Amycolatopsis arida]SFP11050.1 hypothetical protein SAMN05421810_101974 [Amycolatopsis arida]
MKITYLTAVPGTRVSAAANACTAVRRGIGMSMATRPSVEAAAHVYLERRDLTQTARVDADVRRPAFLPVTKDLLIAKQVCVPLPVDERGP